MVRLSLVNMYLHDLVDPKIVEYDTLTSDERWGEYADVPGQSAVQQRDEQPLLNPARFCLWITWPSI